MYLSEFLGLSKDLSETLNADKYRFFYLIQYQEAMKSPIIKNICKPQVVRPLFSANLQLTAFQVRLAFAIKILF